MPWILNEDAALKLRLQGLRAFDINSPPGGRKVDVRFKDPEDELIKLDFPCIIMELQGIYNAPEREHRGVIRLPYAPEGKPIWWNPDLPYQPDAGNGPYRTDYPLPVNIDYKVTLYSRLQRDHSIPLVAALMQPDRLHPKFANKLVIPQDGTARSMFLQGGPDKGYGKDEKGKRVFRDTFLVRIFSEIVLPFDTILPGQYPLVQLINMYTQADPALYYNPDDLTDYDIKEAFSIVGSYTPFAWNTKTSY